MINPHQFHWKLGGIFLTQLKVFKKTKKKVTVTFFISFLFQKKKKKKEKTVKRSGNIFKLFNPHVHAFSGHVIKGRGLKIYK